MKIISFSQQGPRAICILSANGVISSVTLRQPDSSGGTLTYEVLQSKHISFTYFTHCHDSSENVKFPKSIMWIDFYILSNFKSRLLVLLFHI